MRSKNKESLLSLLILTGILGLLHLITALADQSVVWQLRDGASTLLLAAVSFLWFLDISYQDTRTKCLSFSIGCYFTSDLIALIFGYSGILKLYGYISIINVLVFSIGYISIWIRSYKNNNVKLNNNSIYLLRKKPKSIQDLLIAIFSISGLYAGYSFYSNGNLYSYKHGIFSLSLVNDQFIHDHYHVCEQKELFPVISRIEFMLGTKWTIFRNCIVLRKVWDA